MKYVVVGKPEFRSFRSRAGQEMSVLELHTFAPLLFFDKKNGFNGQKVAVFQIWNIGRPDGVTFDGDPMNLPRVPFEINIESHESNGKQYIDYASVGKVLDPQVVMSDLFKAWGVIK